MTEIQSQLIPGNLGCDVLDLCDNGVLDALVLAGCYPQQVRQHQLIAQDLHMRAAGQGRAGQGAGETDT